MREALSKHVAVGLLSDQVGGEIYNGGQTVMEVGAAHEYGINGQRARSFLRMPQELKQREITAAIDKQFKAVFEQNRPVDVALGRVGVFVENITKGAFITGGYGRWPDISQATKDAKGSSKILVDNGILKGSIHSAVRDN